MEQAETAVTTAKKNFTARETEYATANNSWLEAQDAVNAAAAARLNADQEVTAAAATAKECLDAVKASAEDDSTDESLVIATRFTEALEQVRPPICSVVRYIVVVVQQSALYSASTFFALPYDGRAAGGAPSG